MNTSSRSHPKNIRPKGSQVRPLYQGDATGIGRTATGLRNHIRKARREDRGRLELKAGRNDARHRNCEAWTGQIEAKAIDSELRQAVDNQLEYSTRIGRVEV